MAQNPFNMTGYTKLFGSIVDSTIWRESKDTKIVWITMLAKANRDGLVEASLPGLADASRVTIDECIDALNCLSSPDKYSRTKDFEGRRIEEIDGGWKILNHAKYRAKMNADERREYFRLKKQEQRSPSYVHKSPRLSNNVADVTHAEADSYTEAVKKAFEEFWVLYPRKVAKPKAFDAFAKAIKKARLETILVAVRAGCKSEAWRKDGCQFIPHPTTWLNQERWADEENKIPAAQPQIKLPSEIDVCRYGEQKGATVQFSKDWHLMMTRKNWRVNGKIVDWQVEFSSAFAAQR
jgi:hypothetical protein